MSKLKTFAPDLFVIAGIGLTAYGAWDVYRPAAFIIPGIFLTAIGLIGALR